MTIFSDNSGAYKFNPASGPNVYAEEISIEFFEGLEFSEVRQSFGSRIKQSIRIYAGASHIEFEAQVMMEDNANKV